MKPGRNAPCSCGSGKKYKHCCEGKVESRSRVPSPGELNQLIALFNAGRYAELESSARFLLKQYPDSGHVWMGLGLSLQMQGKDALQALQKTAQLLPDDASAHNNLANTLREIGQYDAAVASGRRALRINPDFAEAHSNLGLARLKLGKPDIAVSSFRRALEIKPDFAAAHSNLGYALRELGQFDAAVASCRRALELKPDFADAHNNLGNALQELGQLDGAVASYRCALELRPDLADAHNNLGNALQELGQLDGAVASYRRALELKPDLADAHINLTNALLEQRQYDDAVTMCRRALELRPDFTEIHNNLGVALIELGQPEAAMGSYRRAIELRPDYAEAHNNLGNAHKDIGQYEAALSCFRQALEFRPDYVEALSNLLFALNFTAHPPEYCLEEAHKYGRMVARQVASTGLKKFTSWKCAQRPERLRVGMVSGDFNNHPAGYFLENLLAQLDHTRIELIAYSNSPIADELTARIKPYFAAWKPVFALNDAATARLIHEDGVHILLDLAGHTAKNRLPVFAWKPAPVQAAWLGYFATTGVAEIDYLLADEVGVPEAQRSSFTETIRYLPCTRLCFTAPETGLPVAPLPALQNGYLNFGCFQNLAKVGEEALALWGKIFLALPDAKLRWQCKQFGDPLMVRQQTQRLQQHGIAPERVSLFGNTSRTDYLAAYGAVDMVLDTFPYPGGTTTCEALWMGVPTLTLAGDTLLARQGASLLTAAGLTEWVAVSAEDYAAKALAYARDLSGLATLRNRLREQVAASPLFDAKRFAHGFAEALWGMWKASGQG